MMELHNESLRSRSRGRGSWPPPQTSAREAQAQRGAAPPLFAKHGSRLLATQLYSVWLPPRNAGRLAALVCRERRGSFLPLPARCTSEPYISTHHAWAFCTVSGCPAPHSLRALLPAPASLGCPMPRPRD